MSLLLLMKISWIYVFESSLITYNKSIYRFRQSFIIGTQAIAIACIIIRLRIRFHSTHFRTKSRSERKRNVGIFFINKWLNALISHTNWLLLLLSGLLMKQYIYSENVVLVHEMQMTEIGAGRNLMRHYVAYFHFYLVSQWNLTQNQFVSLIPYTNLYIWIHCVKPVSHSNMICINAYNFYFLFLCSALKVGSISLLISTFQLIPFADHLATVRKKRRMWYLGCVGNGKNA